MNEHRDQRITDSTLTDDLRVTETAPKRLACVLVTGATGFLGLRVVEALLESTSDTIVCLVRAEDTEQGTDRLFAALTQLGVSREKLISRVSVVAGCIDRPQFNLDIALYESLAMRVGRIVHCAAEVNWVKTYAQLRASNVVGTFEVIRFACAGLAKPLCAVSSIATCYVDGRTEHIDESTDTLAWIDAMPLAYAQSKCVAEHLLRNIAKRGLPVTILRPSLLAGDTRTGESSRDDLTAALLDSALRSGVASNADWQLDHVPVDYLARLIARLPVPESGGSARVLHVVNPKPRRWRELVLWLQLYGHEVHLIDTDVWLASVFKDRKVAGEILFIYRRLFLGRANSLIDKRPFSVYLEAGQSAIDSNRSHNYLRELGIAPIPIDPALLHRYLAWFESVGALPAPAGRSIKQTETLTTHGSNEAAMMRAALGLDSATQLFTEQRPFDSSEGLLTALASAASKGIGLTAWRVRIGTGKSCEIVTKTRGDEEGLIDAACVAASEKNSRLGELFVQHQELLAIAGSSERECMLYQIGAPSLSHCTPKTYGSALDLKSGLRTLLLERLPDNAFAPSGMLTDSWDDHAITMAIDALASVQSTPRSSLTPLIRAQQLSYLPSTTRMIDAAALWYELNELMSQRGGNRYLSAKRCEWIDTLVSWWPNYLAQVTTLVHNDCNPRNIAWRITDTSQQTCLIDWELAGFGAPQRDLAELLCFVIDPDTINFNELQIIVERHRERLQKLSGRKLDHSHWLKGFEYALRHIALTRLPLYALVDCYRPLPWLKTVEANTETLVELLDERSYGNKLTEYFSTDSKSMGSS